MARSRDSWLKLSARSQYNRLSMKESNLLNMAVCRERKPNQMAGSAYQLAANDGVAGRLTVRGCCRSISCSNAAMAKLVLPRLCNGVISISVANENLYKAETKAKAAASQ